MSKQNLGVLKVRKEDCQTKISRKFDLEEISSAEQLIRKKNSWLYRSLSKKHLGFFRRVFLKEVAYDLFTRLSFNNRSYLLIYGECFAKGAYPNTEGWKIMREAYENF